jgi:hypothetical protein
MYRRCDRLRGELTLGSVIFQSVFFSLDAPVRWATRLDSWDLSGRKLLWYGGNSLVRTSRTTGEHRAGCSKRLSSKAAASEEAKAYASVR